MIQKIVSISHVGRFESYKAKGVTDWNKLTLLFGENGRGKTTLTAILRSNADSDGALLLGRKTLGQALLPEVELLTNAGVWKFAAGAWSGGSLAMHIFDAHFVQTNVHEGDHVETEHRRNLFNVIVGAVGKQLNQEISGLDDDIRAVTKEIATKRAVLEVSLKGGSSLAEFLGLDTDPLVESKIEKIQKDIAALSNAEIIANGAPLLLIDVPALPSGYSQLLEKTLLDLSASAVAKVTAHMQQHHHDNYASWLMTGTGFVVGTECPFCSAPLDGNELVTAYNSYFGDSYKELRRAIPLMSGVVETAFGVNQVLRVRNTVAENAALHSFWKDFVTFDAPTFNLDDAETLFGQILADLSVGLSQKAANPLDIIENPESYSSASIAYSTLRTRIEAYNLAVATANASIATLKAEVGITDIDVRKADLEILEMCRARQSASVCTSCAEYEALVEKKSALEAKKEAVRKKLNTHNLTVFSKYEKRINDLLDKFNAGFRISNTKGEYPAGKPSSTYNLVINSTPVPLGKGDASLGLPSFRNTLSAGDKSALAFCFFVAQAEADPHLSKKIVLFDDPFTSQDLDRRSTTQHVIKDFVHKAEQVVVLSHEPYFLRGMSDGILSGNVSTLMLDRDGLNASRIASVDLEELLQHDHFRSHGVLIKYLDHGIGSPQDVVRCIRPYLEYVLRVKFPDDCVDGEWLGDYLGKIDKAVPPEELAKLKAERSELGELNNYSKAHHHGDGSFNTKVLIVKNELDAMVKRTLGVAKRL